MDSNELIERWANVERVLAAMPEHERQEHWDMGTWGEKTDCGTVACAAGQCGLDPWFRERGFTLDFDKVGDAKITSVEGFFGYVGSQRIFLNVTPRPVETVIGEVRDYLDELRGFPDLVAGLALPTIGAEWPEQGGIYAGAMRGKDGAQDYLLVVGPEHDGRVPWREANEWAANLSVGEFHDFALFDRRDAAALLNRVQALFQPSYYWTCEQHAGYSGYAWGQYFGDGDQDYWPKGDDDRARAVRRISIQSFGHSVISTEALRP